VLPFGTPTMVLRMYPMGVLIWSGFFWLPYSRCVTCSSMCRFSSPPCVNFFGLGLGWWEAGFFCCIGCTVVFFEYLALSQDVSVASGLPRPPSRLGLRMSPCWPLAVINWSSVGPLLYLLCNLFAVQWINTFWLVFLIYYADCLCMF